jgi:DGQHR domain-containing protein
MQKYKAMMKVQNGRPLFLTWMPAKELRLKEPEDKSPGGIRVDIKSRANPDGYQREPSTTRANAFGRYVGRAKGISPTAILLSLRAPVSLSTEPAKKGYPRFEVEDEVSGYGTLSIPDELPLWLVDGQHRVMGINSLIEDEKYSDYEQFPLAAVILPTGAEVNPK